MSENTLKSLVRCQKLLAVVISDLEQSMGIEGAKEFALAAMCLSEDMRKFAYKFKSNG